MIRITREADYGIVLMSSMAQQVGKSHSAGTLAKQHHLTLPMVSKILKALARHGLLLSQRGPHGGYTLARPATEISAADIISAIEGPIALTECSPEVQGHCVHEGYCGVSNHWQRINRAIRQALETVSLSEMSQPPALPINWPAPRTSGYNQHL